MTVRLCTLLPALAVLAACVVGGVLLWDTTVPGDLELPRLDESEFYTASELDEAEGFERGFYVIVLLGLAAQFAALGFMVWRGSRLVRGVPLGQIGIGIVVGLLTMLAVWSASIPFTLAETWWARRHDVSEIGYVEAVLLPYAELGALTAAALLAIVVVMWLAQRVGRWWWVVAAPVFAGIATGFAFLLPYLLTIDVTGAEDVPGLATRVDALEDATGADDTPVFVEEVSSWTDAPNAYVTGLGPSTRIFLWDTLLDGRYSDNQVDFVVAHELGHVAREHVWKGIAWFAILALPSLLAVHLVTRSRGGLREARNVPLAALVVACVGVCLAPAQNAISRHFEQEADWIGLEATRDPAAAERFFTDLTHTILADPTPPSWSQALFGTHPTDLERIAMARAWKMREAR